MTLENYKKADALYKEKTNIAAVLDAIKDKKNVFNYYFMYDAFTQNKVYLKNEGLLIKLLREELPKLIIKMDNELKNL